MAKSKRKIKLRRKLNGRLYCLDTKKRPSMIGRYCGAERARAT